MWQQYEAKIQNLTWELSAKIDSYKRDPSTAPSVNISYRNPLYTPPSPPPQATSFDFHRCYVQRMNPYGPRVLFVGICPGRNGMGTNGIPFGDPGSVRDYLGIAVPLTSPEQSGRRFWALMQKICPSSGEFFANCFVQNYCPLLLTDVPGSTHMSPDEVQPAALWNDIKNACVAGLVDVLSLLQPDIVVAVGVQANNICVECKALVGAMALQIEFITHPSPQNVRNPWNEAAMMSKLVNSGVMNVMQGPGRPAPPAQNQ